MSLLLRCRNIAKSYGDRQVLGGIDWEIQEGDRIGLVGRNGCGKSTLVNILAGVTGADQGQISYHPPGLIVGLLGQDGSALVLSAPEPGPSADAGLRPVVEEASGHMISRLGLRHIEAASTGGMQLNGVSGGERTRLALARIWSGQPRLLILDEPTNNLDLAGMDWLAREIARLPAAVIVVSHDRRFLDQTVNRIAELQEGQLIFYNGNYSFYRQEKERLFQSQRHAYESQAREERRLDAMVSQLKGWSGKGYRESRHKGRKSGNLMGSKEFYRARAEKKDRAVKSQIRRLEKMRREGVPKPHREAAARFQSLENGSGGRRLLAAQELAKSYDGQVLFRASDFWINRGEKAGIIGPNGCGKSTLLRIILGLEEASGGEIFFSPSSRHAYLAQDAPLQELPALKDRLSRAAPSDLTRICTAMVRLGLDYSALGRSSMELSPGERMKMALALAIDARPDLIILDEPGNHLDLFSLESLQKSLQEYDGSLLLVSHDVYLVQAVCNCLLVFENGRITRRDYPIMDYLAGREQPDERSQRSRDRQDGHSLPGATKHTPVTCREEELLLDNRIALVLGQLSLEKAGTPRYEALEADYRELLQLKRQRQRQRPDIIR